MSLNKEKIAKWISQNFANDYYAFNHICSEVNVLNFEKKDNTLIVEYEFWDDDQATDLQENFLFDIDIGAEYGVNFPAGMKLHKFTDIFSWENDKDLEDLSRNHVEQTNVIMDVTSYKWGDTEIDNWIDHYIAGLDQKSMALMLVERYNAVVTFPKFIPKCLAQHFKKIISTNF